MSKRVPVSFESNCNGVPARSSQIRGTKIMRQHERYAEPQPRAIRETLNSGLDNRGHVLTGWATFPVR